jgi:hypothetical protein
MAAIRSAARKIVGRALVQRPPGVEVARPLRLLPRMLPHDGLLGQPQPPIVRPSRLFSSGSHKTYEPPPNKVLPISPATVNRTNLHATLYSIYSVAFFYRKYTL